MMSDWTYLRKELDRLEGRVMDFGWFAGWRVEQVNLVNRGYLFWCLDAVPMRAELRRTILRVLSRRVGPIRDWRLHAAGPSRKPITSGPTSDDANTSSPAAA